MKFFEDPRYRSELFMILCGFLLVLALGWVDYLTGPEISFSVFYLIPIALTAWFSTRRGAILVAILSASTWLRAEMVWHQAYSSSVVPYWNAGVRLGFFAIVALLLSALKTLQLSLENKVKERTAELQREIAEHKRAEESLLLIASIVEAASEAIIGCDLDGKILSWNPGAEKIYGYKADEVKARSVELLLPPVRQNEFSTLMELTKRGESTNNLETIHLSKAGKAVEVMLTVSPVRNVTGEIIAASVIAGDITDMRRAQREQRLLGERMQHAQRLESLGILAGGIAHDFNNLLTGVLGNADLAATEVPSYSPARRHIEAIRKSAKSAADLTQQMLAYAGRGRFVIEPLWLNALIEDIAHLLTVSISKKIVLKFNFGEDLPRVMADASQMRQVVMNLLTNAAEAIGERSGVISVTTGMVAVNHEYLTRLDAAQDLPEGFYVYLEVSDTGSGMDEETRLRIFEPFFTTKFTGRGLGLSAVLGIVRGHKGAIKVYSEPGKGSTFKILLPTCEQPSVMHNPRASNEDNWRGSGTILVVDDEEDVRSVFRAMLEKMGFTVLTANDGREGLDRLSENATAIRVVILDMTMPRLGGKETFAEIHRLHPQLPVILTSGYNEQDITETFAGKGLSGFIQKPFNYQDLRKKVRDVIEKKS